MLYGLEWPVARSGATPVQYQLSSCKGETVTNALKDYILLVKNEGGSIPPISRQIDPPGGWKNIFHIFVVTFREWCLTGAYSVWSRSVLVQFQLP